MVMLVWVQMVIIRVLNVFPLLMNAICCTVEYAFSIDNNDVNVNVNVNNVVCVVVAIIVVCVVS